MNNFNKLFGVLFCVLITLCFTNCINGIPDEDASLADRIPISISSPITCYTIPLTRMSGDAFDLKDTIGLYVLEQPGTLLQKRYLENIPFICSSEGFAPESPVYYPYGDGKCDFYSYYPYRKEGIPAGENSMPLQVQANQSLASDYFSSDFLVAKVEGISPAKAKVDLPHAHKMCKLEIAIELKGGEDISGLLTKDPQVTLLDVYTHGVYDFVEDTIVSPSMPQTISLYGEWKVKEKKLIGKSAVLIPQTVTAGTKLLRMQVGDRSFWGILPSKFKLESGKICSLTLGYDPKIGIDDLNPTIIDWEDEGDSINIDTEEEINEGWVQIAENDFKETAVLDVLCQGEVVAMVCKEYLYSKGIINAQAIVVYPVNASGVDLKQGRVLRLLGNAENQHGGLVSWNTEGSSFTYSPGTSLPYTGFYMTKNKSVAVEKPANVLPATIRKRLLNDVRGGKQVNYPIVKIGTQYWMQANLHVAKYTDGSDIPLLGVEGTTHGYRVVGNEYYYNQSAAENKKLSPDRWRVSSQTDWEVLLDYLGNSVTSIKNGSLWGSGYDNLTGFNCDLIGLFSVNTSGDGSLYDYEETYTGYWQISETCNIILISAQQAEPKIRDSSPFYGLSVRCVSEELP